MSETLEAAGLRIQVREAPEWSALFKRRTGWTGSDGIYTVPLSGHEGAGRLAGRQVLVFGDTFIGDVDQSGARRHCRMVYNTLAMLENGHPREEELRLCADW